MSYIKTNWVDGTTPISATNLNKIETGIEKNSLETAFEHYSTTDVGNETYVDLSKNNADMVLYVDREGIFHFTLMLLPNDKERILAIHWESGNSLSITNGTSRTIIGDVWNSFSGLSDSTCIIIRFTPVGDYTVATVRRIYKMN